MAKIITNIPQLDNQLGGGIAQGTLTCVWIQPGVNGSPFAYQIANSAAKTNKVFYIHNSKAATTIQADMKAFGLGAGKISFVDSYSALINKKPATKLSIANPKDANELISAVQIITKKIKNPVIVLDSFSTLIDLAESKGVEVLTKLKQLKATFICLFTEWPYEPALIKNLRAAFDSIISVKTVEKQLFSRFYFGVTKANGKAVKSLALPFKLTQPGGIKLYIPKVLVTGPFNAGKSSLIHSASEKAVSVDRLGTTIALDHGHVKYKDFAVDLFGTPGQQRFDPILKLLGGESLGVILVVSAVDPQSFPRAFEMMKKAKVYGLPVVFAANKSNLRGALSVEQIKTRLKLKDEIVIPLTAKDLTKVQPGIPCQIKQADLIKLLDALFGSLLKDVIK